MYKSPAAPSNLIHIMKSLWRLKSNGPFAYQKHTQTYSSARDLLPAGASASGRASEKLLRVPTVWVSFRRLPIRIRQRGNKGDGGAVGGRRGVPPVSRWRTGDNVSAVGINLPHLRAEIKATRESGTTRHQRRGDERNRSFQLEQRHPVSANRGRQEALKRTSDPRSKLLQ